MNARDLMGLIDLAAERYKKVIDLEARILRRVVARISLEDDERAAADEEIIRSKTDDLQEGSGAHKGPDNVVYLRDYQMPGHHGPGAEKRHH